MAERYSTDGVQALADEFIRFKRYVEDALENLDVNNFADGAWKKMVTKFGDVSSAGFEAYADAEKAIARMFAEYKTEINKSIASVEAVADANGASITQLVTWQGNVDTSINNLQIRDSSLAESISQIEQTANGNGATIASLVEWKGDAQKSAASIEQAADANGAFIKMLVSAGSNGDKDPSDVIASDIAGIYITAMNNNSTEIKLNAKIIAFGDSAVVDESGLKVTRIWDNESTASYYAKVYSKLGDFGIYSAGASATSNPESPDCLWGVYNSIDGLSFTHKGNSYMSIGANSAIFPKGDWDFSMCNVSNIPLYFS